MEADEQWEMDGKDEGWLQGPRRALGTKRSHGGFGAEKRWNLG